MATLYVSNQATNGYLVGHDTLFDGSSKLTPLLTLAQAQTDASANDTIIINDGTFDEDLFLNKDLIWTAENSRQVTITNPNGGDDRVIDTSANVNIALSGLRVDGQGVQASGIRGGVGYSLTAIDIEVFGANNYGIYSRGNLTVIGCSVHGTMDISGISHQPSNNNNIAVISLSSFNINAANTANAIGLAPEAGVTGVVARIRDNTINVNITGSGNPTGITSGLVTADRQPSELYVTGNTITLNGSTAPSGVLVNDDTTLAMDVAIVEGNKITNLHDVAATGGYGVLIGEETSGGYQGIGVCKIIGNEVSGMDHGTMIGYQTNGQVYGNTIENCVLGVLFDGCTSCWSAGNHIKDPQDTANCLFHKDSTNCIHANNTIEISNNYGGAALQQDDDLAVGSGNQFIANNVIIREGGSISEVVEVASGETGRVTFTRNNYYDENGAFGATAFDYGGTSYDFGEWVTNAESDATNLAEPGNNGTAWWGSTIPRPTDLNGEPFPDIAPPVGAVVDTTSPFHPENL